MDGRPHLSASRLLERRKEFNRNLVNIVKQHHKVRCPHSLAPSGFGVWGCSGCYREEPKEQADIQAEGRGRFLWDALGRLVWVARMAAGMSPGSEFPPSQLPHVAKPCQEHGGGGQLPCTRPTGAVTQLSPLSRRSWLLSALPWWCQRRS